MTVNKQKSASGSSQIQASNLIRGLYRGLLLREPTDSEVREWLDVYQTEADAIAIVGNFISSDEYADRLASEARSVYLDPTRMATIAKPLAALLFERPLTIVDIGAQNLSDEEHVYGPITKNGMPHRIIGFEPLEHRREERLQAQGHENTVLLPAFIGDGTRRTFHINAPDSTSSLFPFNRNVTDHLIGLDHLKTVEVEMVDTTTLDDALRNYGDVDFIKLDIQGAELLALQNAQVTLAKTLVVHCEVLFAEMYEGQAFFSDIDSLMRKAGFDLIDLPYLCKYPVVGTKSFKSKDRLGWGDAIYFRKLPGDAHWRDFLVQSAFAIAVYDKPSLALALAKRLNDGPAKSYWDSLQQLVE